MQKIDLTKTDTSQMKARYCLQDIADFVNDDKCRNGKIVVLFGLRRTGKTTVMEQALKQYSETRRCAFYSVESDDDMDAVRDVIIHERELGTSLICFDEITKAWDFISRASILPDVFAKEGMNIIVAGTDSLGFLFAESPELYDRTMRIRTTHVPFAEHKDVLGVSDIDEYIMYGGLMCKGASERQVFDFESAKKYLDEAVAGNIASSISKDARISELKQLTQNDISTIIEKMVEIYSGIFNKEQMQKALSSVSVNVVFDFLSKSEYSDLIKPVSLKKRDITRDFTKKINADSILSTTVTDNMVLRLEQYLLEMDLLSAITKKTFRFSDDFGWIEEPDEKEFYIVQPAIKYYHLKKGIEMIEGEYFKALPEAVLKQMKTKLSEKIKGDMTEQIVVFDTRKSLDYERYYVCKPEFYINGLKNGEYDMLIYDRDTDSYWSFEIKHSEVSSDLQTKHLNNEVISEIVDMKYGKKNNSCVLYRGKSFLSENGILYFNISDFLTSIYNCHDVSKAFAELSKTIEMPAIHKPRKVYGPEL